MYEIIFSKKAEKQFFKLEKKIQDRIEKVLDRIKIRPESYLVKLVDDPGYKLRIGDYRVIVDVDKRKLMILVINIGHRKNIYKK